MKEYLTFLLNRGDLSCLEALFPEALAEALVAFDPDLHIHFLRRGVDHLTPWSFIERDEHGAVRDFDRAVWKFWARNAEAVFEGIDLLGMARFRHMSCFSRIAWAAYVIRKVLTEIQPQQVVVFEEKTGHGLEQPPEHNHMPLLQALVRGFAEQEGFAVRVLRREDVPGAVGFVDWVAKRGGRQLDPVDPAEFLDGRPYVLLPGSGVDLLRPLPLVRELHDAGEVAVVQLYKSADESTLRKIKDVGHLVWHESQLLGNIPRPQPPRCASDARARFDEARRRAPTHLRPIFSNPYLDIHFDFIFGEYVAKMAENFLAWRSFLDRHPPLILVATSYCPAVDVASAVGIPSLGLPHGSMMVGNTRWFECYRSSIVGALNERHRRRLIDAGLEAERIEVTGDAGLESSLRSSESGGGAAPTLNRRERWGIAPEQRGVLLVMGNMGMLAKLGDLPLYDWAESVRCFRELGGLAERHPDWRLLVRPHPRYDHPELYELVNRELADDRKIIVLPQQALEPLVQSVDAVVICNVVTSAILEASLCCRPVVVLSASMIWYHPQEWATEDWPHAPSVAALERELQAMFSSDERYREAVNRSESAARQYLAGGGASGVANCVNLIYESARLPTKT